MFNYSLRKQIKKMVILTTLAFPLPVVAEYQEKQIHTFGLETAYYSYDEPGYMKASGPLLGLNGEYVYNIDRKYFVGVDARTLLGVVNYNGHLYNLDTGARTPYRNGYDTNNFLFEARITPGFHYEQYQFYAGLGYRLKADSPRSSDSYAYDRQSQYLYLPIGMKMSTVMFGIETVPYLEYDVFLGGRQVSGSLGRKNVNIQDNGLGLKAGIAFKMNDFEIVPYVNYWHVNDSDTIRVPYKDRFLSMTEPENNTWEVGVKVTCRF